MPGRIGLFDGVQPFASGLLEVGDGHSLYHEQCGRIDGLPVLFLHGGPGSGCSPRHRAFFDPAATRAVLFDQRGCGRSQPRGSLIVNHSDALVADIEHLRQHLGIERWLVFGGSWGSSLALAYATAHPQACMGLLLRGVFLGRRSDLDWFFHGAAQILPDAWAVLAAPAPQTPGEDLLAWYCAAVLDADEGAAASAAAIWSAWDQALTDRRWARVGNSAAPTASVPSDAARALLDKYRIQAHYLRHLCFFQERPVLERLRASGGLPGIPVCIVHGRLDGVCRPQGAWELHQALPGSSLRWIDEAGHNPFEPPMAQALLDCLADFARHRSFPS